MINGVLSSGLVSAGASGAASSKNSPEKVAEAAKQFEGLLIGEMFKTMHSDSSEGWLGTGEDQTASSAMGMADEYFAQAIANHGGFGLAKMVSHQLKPASTPTE
jgi:Rod binding domain-containing protein